MIEDDEAVCVALSGGKDSVTLLFILYYLLQFSYLNFTLSAAHIKTGEYDTTVLQQLCDTLNIRYLEDSLDFERVPPEKSVCSLCARLKRGALAKLLAERQIRTVAYGHHADDVAETFFMNIIQNRKLGSFSPRVEVEHSALEIIRPMLYLDERTIRSIHRHAGLPVLDSQCHYAAANIRRQYKEYVAGLDDVFHTSGFVKKLVAALENVDTTNIWSEVRREDTP